MITIVVGGQFGGEGKGKVCAYLGLADKPDLVCRTGGVNSSHTVWSDGNQYRLRMMPASAVAHRSLVIFGAGSLLHLPTFFQEAELLGISLDDIRIDPMAGLVTDECVAEQRADQRYRKIGSTLTGTGYASASRCQRRLPLAKSRRELKRFLVDVPELLASSARSGKSILVEGHQGSGLSNYHGDYPYTSSRDCIAAALMSELGIGPALNTEVVLTIKIFPTRNHGGRLPREMSEEESSNLGIAEFGGGSWGVEDNRRRVGRLEITTVKRAILLNTPRYVALTGFDYLFPNLRGAKALCDLSAAAAKYLNFLERRLEIKIGLVSTGPETESVVDLRSVRQTAIESARIAESDG